MSAKLLDISDTTITLPEFLVLDSSLILELTPNPGAPHKNHALAIGFLNRLRVNAQSGSVKPLLPLLAFEECCFKICQRILTQYGQLMGLRWHEYYKQQPFSIRTIYPLLEQLRGNLLSFPIEITEPEDLAIYTRGKEKPLSERMNELINRFAILPKDATILSEAERLGIDTVVTLDSDLTRATGFTIITALPIPSASPRP
jgi:predicted nucleic acid-binding protein